jgi:predicted transcriptional regulator
MATKLKVVGFHLDEAHETKLAALAQATQRSRSGVIRLLLAQATIEQQPDIRLAPIGGYLCDATVSPGDGAQ